MVDEDKQREQAGSWRYLDHPAALGFSHLGKWSMAVAQQAERVLDSGRDMALRQTDGYLLVLALRQVLRAAYMVRDGLTDENRPEQADVARVALEAFEHLVPDAKNARDVLDHFDDYARGLGNLSHPGVSRPRRSATEEAARSFEIFYEAGGEGHYVLHLGSLTIDVAEAQRAVEELHSAMHTAIGLIEADDDEAMASFGPHVLTNPAFTGWAFFALINMDLTDDTVGKLRAVVTPESIPAWGDFGEVKTSLARHSIASKVHYLDQDTAYMKFLPDVDRTRQVANDGFPIVDPLFITLQRRPDQGGEWRVFSTGTRFHQPDELPPPP